MQSPEFKGTMNLMKVESWVMQLQEIFGVIGYVDDQRVSLDTFMIKSEVKHGWHTMRDTLVGEYVMPPTWETFLKAFKD